MTATSFVKFTMQRHNENEPLKFAFIRVGEIVTVSSMVYEQVMRSTQRVNRDGCQIATPWTVSYVAHTYTDVMNLIKAAHEKETLL